MATPNDKNADFFDSEVNNNPSSTSPRRQPATVGKSPNPAGTKASPPLAKSGGRYPKANQSSPRSLASSATKGSLQQNGQSPMLHGDLTPIAGGGGNGNGSGGRGNNGSGSRQQQSSRNGETSAMLGSSSSPGGDGGDELVYNWDGFVNRVGPRAKRNFTLNCALIASLGSFALGYSISVLNTALNPINSEFLQCGPKKTEYSAYWNIAPEACAADPNCRKVCGVFTDPLDKEHLTQVRCPGGYNDTSCSEIKWYNAALISIVLFGSAIGAVLGGRIVKSGRRRLQIIEHCVMIVGSLISVCSTSYQSLILGRLIVGIGGGLTSIGSPTYISEMSAASKRGMFGTFHQLSVVIGQFVALCIGVPLTSPDEQNDSWTPTLFNKVYWRCMVGFIILLNLLALYLLFERFSMETPFFYAEKRHFQDAQRGLQLVNQKLDIENEFNSITNAIRQMEITKQSGLTFGQAVRRSPEYLKVVIIGCLIAGFQQFGGINVFLTSSAELFRKNGMDRHMQLLMSMIMGLLLVLFTIPAIFLVERLGRRILLLVGSTFQFLFIIPAAVLYQLEEVPSNPSQITRLASTVGIFGFVSSFSMAFGPIVWIYLFEIFPAEIKDTAASLATAFNWSSAVIMVFAANLLPNQVSFLLFAVLQGIATVFIFFCIRETKGLALGDSPYITKSLSVAV